MPDERLSKNQRREQARELARIEREKQKRRERLLRWAVPSSVTVVILAIVAVVIIVVVNSAPAPQTKAGPKNMITDGILFTGVNGKMVPTKTGAIPAKGTPSPIPTSGGDGVVQIVTYVDFSCPGCQAFEAANATQIEQMVESGAATLEVHPIAILDPNSLTSRYSSRANNVGACVANYAPDDFYKVMQQMYTEQPKEGTDGLTNSQIVKVVHDAGLNNSDVDKCINGESFKSWVAAATNRATSDPSLRDPTGQFFTPTIVINGQRYGGATDAATFGAFLQQAAAS